jgi:pimeloyl-ACP methyl ester carboxylesterase
MTTLASDASHTADAAQAWTDRFFWSRDGVRLHVREYGTGQPGRPTVLCIPGLTRNARDFEALAPHLAQSFRVWALNLRGRGDSGWAKDPMSYVPLTYLQDLEQLVEQLKPDQLVIIGTSLGGILAMLAGGPLGQHLSGAVLNDVGPEIDPAGLLRIRGYVGRTGRYPTWMHAARAVAEVNQVAFPDYDLTDWLRFAKRTCRLEASGRIVFDYDPKLAEPFKLPGNEAGVDLWPAFDALATGRPVLVVRGATSDILAAATLERMAARAPTVETLSVPGIGHAPTLDEPAVVAAIEGFLGRFL